jgi:hypothetical protein
LTQFKSSQKRPAPASTPLPLSKRPRLSEGTAALQKLASTVVDFGQVVRTALAPPAATSLEATPQRRRSAILQVQKYEDWMSIPQKVSLIKLFQGDKATMDTYSALEDKELRVEWIKDQLNIA